MTDNYDIIKDFLVPTEILVEELGPTRSKIILEKRTLRGGQVGQNGQLLGKWKDGKMEGKGVLTLPDGEKFRGKFKDGKIYGKGELVLQNGKKFDEQFQSI